MGDVIFIPHSNCGQPIPCKVGKPLPLPVYLNKVPAGFPSPAEDYEDGPLDLNQKLIKRPAATYFVYAQGHSMVGAGIMDGAMLVVDRSVTPSPGRVVVAAINGELTVKRLMKRNGEYYLKAENPVYPELHFVEGDTMQIWGVVEYVVNPLNKA